jgi:hypothetical protein
MIALLKRAPSEIRDVDLNGVLRKVFDFLGTQVSGRNVVLHLQPAPGEMRTRRGNCPGPFTLLMTTHLSGSPSSGA